MSNFTTAIETIKTRVNHRCACFDIFDASGYGLADIPNAYHSSVIRMTSSDGVIKAGSECYSWSGCFDGEMFTAYSDRDMYLRFWP